MLRLAGDPGYAAERTARHPLVVIGGAVTFVNPEPLALFADVIAAGEGEALIPGAASARLRPRRDRADLLRLLARERGFYVPSFYEPHYAADGTIAGVRRPRRRRRRRAGAQGRAEDDRSGRSTSDEHLHARYRVRIALPRGSRPRLREPVPVLLGRLQLPAGPRVPGRSHPRARGRGAALRQPRRARVDRAVRSPGDRTDSRATPRDSATASAPPRCASTI